MEAINHSIICQKMKSIYLEEYICLILDPFYSVHMISVPFEYVCHFSIKSHQALLVINVMFYMCFTGACQFQMNKAETWHCGICRVFIPFHVTSSFYCSHFHQIIIHFLWVHLLLETTF